MPSDPSVADPTLERILAFLRQVGLRVAEAPVEDEAFLPGVRIADGGLVFDRTRLRWPGDLLHEAGHLAVLPAAVRDSFSGDLAGHEDIPHAGELEAMAWAYAATLAAGLDPSVLFHEGGYRGQSAALQLTYAMGVHPGAEGLAKAGLTHRRTAEDTMGPATYPAMRQWLRD